MNIAKHIMIIGKGLATFISVDVMKYTVALIQSAQSHKQAFTKTLCCIFEIIGPVLFCPCEFMILQHIGGSPYGFFFEYCVIVAHVFCLFWSHLWFGFPCHKVS